MLYDNEQFILLLNWCNVALFNKLSQLYGDLRYNQHFMHFYQYL